jgi:NADH dehydrogenase
MHFTPNKIENSHELEKFEWQKPHKPNLTGSNEAYSPKDNTDAIKKKYKTWKS